MFLVGEERAVGVRELRVHRIGERNERVRGSGVMRIRGIGRGETGRFKTYITFTLQYMNDVRKCA